MGARRNDDVDLELRDDYFTPSSRDAVHSPADPPVPSTTAPMPGSGGVVKTTRTGLTTYLPFGYLYFSSPSTKNDANNESTNANGSTSETPAVPPRAAFPPPISGSNTDNLGTGAREEGMHPNREYAASHPWYHQNALTEENDDNFNPHGQHFDNHPTRRKFLNKGKGHMSWQDKKAIIGTTFNLTNSIIGAGAIGLGGAFAASGGGVSILCLLGFAYLTKLSLDLIVDLSSCPDVIRKVRVEEFQYDFEAIDERNSPDRSSYYESQRFNADIRNRDPQADDTRDNSLGTSQSQNEKVDQVDVKDTSINEELKTRDNEETAQTWNQSEESPLMAQELCWDTNIHDPVADLPLKSRKQFRSPLDSSLGAEMEGTNRYDSLNTGPTSANPLSLLKVDSDGIPITTLQSTEPFLSNVLQNEEIVQPCTYEELGRAAYGSSGRLAVIVSKCLYSFGCLVAYVVVVRDNFGPALRRMVWDSESRPSLLVNAFSWGLWSHDNGIGCSDSGARDSDRCRRNITDEDTYVPAWIHDDDYLAFLVSALIMLPLSCPRTMVPLAKFSFVSVVSIMFLALSVVYLYFSCSDPVARESEFYENWLEIKSFSGLFESLGTFVFTFVCHHTVNLAYESLPLNLRNPKTWRTVSTNSIVMSTEASLTIGLFAYMTFGAHTPADVLVAYPPNVSLANILRLLLCLTMVLTFPLPFLTCREMAVLIMVDAHRLFHYHRLGRFNMTSWVLACFPFVRRRLWTFLFKKKNTDPLNTVEGVEGFVQMQPRIPVPQRLKNWGKQLWFCNNDIDEGWLDPARQTTQALLSETEEENPLLNSSIGGLKGEEDVPSPLSSPEPSYSSYEESSSEESTPTVRVHAPRWLLRNGNGRQLSFLWHAALTFVLWMLATMCAIKSPSLGDVLNLVGAFTGTLLAFILPAFFSFKLKGYSHISFTILAIGGIVGICGTISSLVKFVRDIHS
jgi:amino acid permease